MGNCIVLLNPFSLVSWREHVKCGLNAIPKYDKLALLVDHSFGWMR